MLYSELITVLLEYVTVLLEYILFYNVEELYPPPILKCSLCAISISELKFDKGRFSCIYYTHTVIHCTKNVSEVAC